MAGEVRLRDVRRDDLAAFFEQQRDPDANDMAAFTPRDPSDHDAFMARWARILGNETGTVQTILLDGQVAGSVLSYQESESGRCEVSYWVGKEYWGRGVATRALAEFLAHVVTERPLYARAAKDNLASLRVLRKCGFAICGEDKGFANARGHEVEEYILILSDDARDDEP